MEVKREFFNMMSSGVLLVLVESDNDMDILEINGVIETGLKISTVIILTIIMLHY